MAESDPTEEVDDLFENATIKRDGESRLRLEDTKWLWDVLQDPKPSSNTHGMSRPLSGRFEYTLAQCRPHQPPPHTLLVHPSLTLEDAQRAQASHLTNGDGLL